MENNSLSDNLDFFHDDIFFRDFKTLQIQQSLRNNDKLALKTFSISNGGFLTNSLRIEVWCKLTNVDFNLKTKQNSETKEIIERNQNYRQVVLDVERSLKRFPPSVHESQRISYQDSLTNVIIKILDKNPSFYYYQGYHDVCLTVLLISDEERALRLINQISLTHLKYFMEKTMNTTSNMLEIIYLILKDEDKILYDYLIKSEVGTIFSLSWVITWFSHVLNDLDDILRLFDFFISTHFLMPIYMSISILLYKKEEILLIDCDMASMHKYLTSIPQEQLPIDHLVYNSLILTNKYPPEDTLLRQKEVERHALNEDDDLLIRVKKSCIYFRKNVFSVAIIGLLTALVYQCYFNYFY